MAVLDFISFYGYSAYAVQPHTQTISGWNSDIKNCSRSTPENPVKMYVKQINKSLIFAFDCKTNIHTLLKAKNTQNSCGL